MRYFRKSYVSTVVAVLALFCCAPLAAQHLCPAGPGRGERQIGAQGGGRGVAPVPICEFVNSRPRQEGAPAWYEPGGKIGWEQPYQAPSPKNVWKFPESEKGVCTALFVANGGFIILELPKALTTSGIPKARFRSHDVPRNVGAKAEPVDIVFESGQTGGRMTSQSVRGVYEPNGGEYVLAVATSEMLLNSIEDRMSFKLIAAGDTKVDLSWVDGSSAKARLAECLGTPR